MPMYVSSYNVLNGHYKWTDKEDKCYTYLTRNIDQCRGDIMDTGGEGKYERQIYISCRCLVWCQFKYAKR